MSYTPENTKIAVIGGGNIGTQLACVCASKGYEVRLLSSKPSLFSGDLEIVDENDNVTRGHVSLVSSSYAEVVSGCRIVFVTHPAFRLKEVADSLLPFVSSDMVICVLPGTGGSEFSFRKCIDAGASLCGLQRVPSVARLEEYGRRVRCEGLRSSLFLGAIPQSSASDMCTFMSSLWGVPCTALPNYLSVTLTPSNPILHTTRLCTLFGDYSAGKVYPRNPLFYGEWSDESSKLLLACDKELQEMLLLMPSLDLSNVRSLKLHYESATVPEMTAKLSGIRSLHGLSSPMTQVPGGWVPDFSSRYFTADFPYGLAIIEEFASILGYSAPNINATMDWYRSVTGDMSELELSSYGLSSLDDIYELYGRV